MNNVSLIGRLTSDPELRHTQSGVAMTRFTVAVDRRVRAGEEKQADFISVTAWQQRAEFVCKYFSKGNRIALTGSIRTGSYTDRDGNKRYTTDVWADTVMAEKATATAGSPIVRIPLRHRRIQAAIQEISWICRQMRICPFNN